MANPPEEEGRRFGDSVDRKDQQVESVSTTGETRGYIDESCLPYWREQRHKNGFPYLYQPEKSSVSKSRIIYSVIAGGIIATWTDLMIEAYILNHTPVQVNTGG